MGAETYIADRINNATSTVVDFEGRTFDVDGTIAMSATTNVVEVRNLNINVNSASSFTVLELPRFADNTPDRVFRNIQIEKTGGAGTIVGIEARCTDARFDHIVIRGCDTGFRTLGLNICTFVSCVFDGGATGFEVNRDTDEVGVGFVGNGNRFFGCNFRQNTAYGYRAVANSVEVGGSAGNDQNFFGCDFETVENGELLRLANGYYYSFSGCRFEASYDDASDIYMVHLKEELSGDLQRVDFNNCIFACSSSGAGDNYCLFVESAVQEVRVFQSTLSASNSGAGSAVHYSGPVRGSWNRNGPNTVHQLGHAKSNGSAVSSSVSSSPGHELVVPTLQLDTFGSGDFSVDNNRLQYDGSETITAKIVARATCYAATAGIHYFDVQDNGTSDATTRQMVYLDTAGPREVTVTDLRELSTGDEINMGVFRSSGSASNVTTRSYSITIERISP